MTSEQETLEETGLIYASDSSAGISRKKYGNEFVYFDKKGNKVTDEKILDRIKKLVIPPAWTEVWIAEKKNAHLQATGIDAAGRKQYKYHHDWARHRNETKYFRLLEFGNKLPEFRKNIAKDLRRKELDERKVLAISVNMMQKTLIRIGNESYKQLYGSYGLTTLRDKHVKINGNSLRLSFKGKKGVLHDIDISDRSLARLVKKCRDIPGQELFQYYTADGDRKSIDSGKVNNYIKEISCCDFTAKDFRTWAGTMHTMKHLAEFDYPENATLKKKIIVTAIDQVAAKLGNTRAICKKSYVFPALLDEYENGSLLPYLKKLSRSSKIAGENGLNHDEKILLSFLKAEKKKKSVSRTK
ncbi:DNA topoisomerase IB [Daejeonella lutea]|uniref:DNA topoisomerase n=1 Tax=Daejeonella lutea TaxID=572036 RepID=A0A1T5F188_9SPHI|nr:DNA topoisomerase IB [Daejeonella lutea]SKB89760.1 DNA topoisomerase-1 [Daejeonella lutea]